MTFTTSSHSRRRRSAACGFAILSAVACGAASPAPAAPAPAPAASATRPDAPSNTRSSLRVVTVRSSPGAAPDLEAVLARLKTDEVAGAIGKEVLGLSPQDALETVVRADAVGAKGTNAFLISVLVDPVRFPNARPAAKEFADKLVAQLPKLLVDERAGVNIPALEEATERHDATKADYDRVVKELREREATLGGQTPTGARAALAKLEDEQQRIELDLAGMQARQKAVEDWIDQTSRKAQQQAKSDPVLAEMAKALEAQEKSLALIRKLYESGNVAASEIPNAESKVAEARIAMLERQQAVGGGGFAAGGATADPVAALNRELQTLSIDVVDRKARLAFIEKRIGPLREAASMATDFDVLESERSALRRDLEQARRDLRLARQATRLVPVDRLAVVESKDEAEAKTAE